VTKVCQSSEQLSNCYGRSFLANFSPYIIRAQHSNEFNWCCYCSCRRQTRESAIKWACILCGNPSRRLLSNILQALNIKCVRKVEKSHPERCYYANRCLKTQNRANLLCTRSRPTSSSRFIVNSNVNKVNGKKTSFTARQKVGYIRILELSTLD